MAHSFRFQVEFLHQASILLKPLLATKVAPEFVRDQRPRIQA